MRKTWFAYKRWLAFLLALAMICIMGCNDTNKKNKPDLYDNLQPAALEPVEISIYTYGNPPSSIKGAIEANLEQISIATAETINVMPRFFWIPYDQYDAKIQEIVSSGQKIDAFTCFSPQSFIQQGLCLDLTGLFKQYAPTYYDDLMANPLGRDYFSGYSADGSLYAIPYNGISNPRRCVVTRAELAGKYAPEGLETLEDYGLFLEKIKENESKFSYPGVVDSHEFFQAYMEGNGYFGNVATFLFSRWDENGENLYSIEQTPEFIDALHLVKNWKEKQYILPDTRQQHLYTIENGKVASMLLRMEHVSDFFSIASRSDAQFKVIPLYMESLHLLYTSARGVAVSQSSLNPERVLMFMEWIHGSQSNYDLFMYGVEGTNYILENESMRFPNAEVDPLDAWKNYGADFFRDFRYDRIVSNVDSNFRQVYQEASFVNIKTSLDLYQMIQKKVEDQQTEMEELGRQFSQTDEIINSYFENMNTFIQTVESGIFGMTVDELKTKQKEAGIETVLDLYTKMMSGF